MHKAPASDVSSDPDDIAEQLPEYEFFCKTDIKSAKISAEYSFSIDFLLNNCIYTNVLKKN